MKLSVKEGGMSRIKQFILDLASPFRRIDYKFTSDYLNSVEGSQLKRLRKAEILHLIAVTKTLKQLIEKDATLIGLKNVELDKMYKAALLHDIGKVYYKSGPIIKTLTVLINKVFGEETRRFANWKAWDIYKNHPEYSYQLVVQMKSLEEYAFLRDLIRYHHKPEIFYDKYDGFERRVFDLFQQADGKH